MVTATRIIEKPACPEAVWLGVQRLAFAVLNQAVKDLREGNLEMKLECREWLLSDGPDSAELWVDVCSLDPDAFHDRALRVCGEVFREVVNNWKEENNGQ